MGKEEQQREIGNDRHTEACFFTIISETKILEFKINMSMLFYDDESECWAPSGGGSILKSG